MKKPIHKRRPAETTSGIAGTVALVIIETFHLPRRDVGIITGAIGFIAAAVTFVAAHGGIKGTIAWAKAKVGLR